MAPMTAIPGPACGSASGSGHGSGHGCHGSGGPGGFMVDSWRAKTSRWNPWALQCDFPSGYDGWPWYRWPIEIDGLPFLKMGGSFHGKPLNNQMIMWFDMKFIWNSYGCVMMFFVIFLWLKLIQTDRFCRYYLLPDTPGKCFRSGKYIAWFAESHELSTMAKSFLIPSVF